ncbi:hypothetical protein MYCTH_101575 [Thermothelomyces thermophilus ATCC 42464]|uniref:RRM domain-containing protein n=1 Tax=Thermothelomyces thermophilus (strain ATCC 42464 / BCRC 31852 / DSM 1799) TaxID=573729 RepID=G2QBK4_THET4|nr:uncharacterized protein MYCTH_101575 [Thermothelomyces thermophilus ATCC 42464]AEO57947.1 hypothetical protein MYCTH_101575 [Thermothelomyces thermophilus ATCC 42464]
MHRKQRHSRGLEPFTVRPGSETGLYYILVANLAPRTTWRELKAFASQACEVDHAEVYPPTSGFVRFLDGNTLDYRALQADGRNLNQSTVVKLMPTDYHAARILRGDEGRIYNEPESPASDSAEPLPQGASAVLGSPHLGFQGRNSPAFSVPDTQWSYVTSSSYTDDGGRYQPAPHAIVMPSISGAYQVVAASSHGFVAQAPITPPITAYRTVPGPTGTAAHITQHQYNDPRMYYPAGTASTMGVPGYAGFVHMTGSGCGHLSAMAYEWPLVPTHSPLQGDMTASHKSAKILIRGLERNRLSPAVVTDLLVQNAGIGATPGQVEKVELPLNKDGKARGIAYITFSTEELAGAAVTALEGCKAGGSRKLSARLVVEGVSPEGSDDGAPRPYQRLAGGGGSRGGGRAGSSSKRGAGGKAPKSSLQEQSPRTSTETLLVQLKSDTAVSALPSAASDGQRKKEERPVIVDGSGGRWKKEPAPVVVGRTAGK